MQRNIGSMASATAATARKVGRKEGRKGEKEGGREKRRVGEYGMGREGIKNSPSNPEDVILKD